MTDLARHPYSGLVRAGLALAAALGLAALGVFLSALAVAASVLVFKTNVFAASDVLIALATAVPLAGFGAALVHRRLWGREAGAA